MITDHVPFPPNKGTYIRNYNLLKQITTEHEVWLAALSKSDTVQEGRSHLLEFCAGVEITKGKQFRALDRPLSALKYFIRGIPIELRHNHSSDFIEKLQWLVSSIDFDVIDIVDSHMGLYLDALPYELHQKTVLTFIDVVFNKFERISRLEPRLRRRLRLQLYSRMMRRWEPLYAERFARCITVSESDRRLLLSFNSRLEIDLAPNGIDTKQYQPLPYSNGKPALLFIGSMKYRPNIDGAVYFCQDVYPQIKAEIPDIELWITGHRPTQEVRDLARDDIHITGYVDDVRPYYERSTVSIIPLRAGGGTRLKILESMALGKPVVSTSIGCEGLDVVDGEHLFIADTSEQFAEKTLRLIKDKELRKKMIEKARNLVVNQYDWEVIAQRLIRTYTEVAK
jgi:sugar transferase (PEP-CTERM/EpsH1 system associated)